MHEGLRQSDTLFVALRQMTDDGACHMCHPGLLHGIVQAGAQACRWDSLDPGNEAEVRLHRHVQIQWWLLGQITDAPPDLQRIFADVKTVDAGRAGCRRQVTGQHPHRGCLAGAVGAKKPHDLPGLSPEREAVDGRDVAVLLGQFAHFDHRSDSSCSRNSVVVHTALEKAGQGFYVLARCGVDADLVNCESTKGTRASSNSLLPVVGKGLSDTLIGTVDDDLFT